MTDYFFGVSINDIKWLFEPKYEGQEQEDGLYTG
jgi:hypothetical protein